MSKPDFEIDAYRVSEGETVDLTKRPTRVAPVFTSKDDYKKILEDHVEKLSKLQHVLYASDSYALLLVLQGMDTAGKDGAIRHVMSGINPQGCEVHSFKQPSEMELQHDFLWRANLALPERGRIGIFNRSHYEELAVVRVHPELLANEGFDPKVAEDPAFWKKRFASITAFETHLHRNHVRIVKFFLHLSKEEQKNRFLARIDEPEKNWKFSHADITERQYWGRYMQVYGEALSATSTERAPWYVIPADDKENARLLISRVVLKTLEALPLHYPQVSDERRQQLLEIRQELVAET